VVISGCSGGGKSTLLAELGARGWPIFPEPGRQIVKEQLAIGGDALPWAADGGARFLELALSRAMHQMTLAAQLDRTCFFDRGVVDAVAGLRTLGAPPWAETALQRFRYAPRMFMIPPWPEIFATDAERQHGFEAALADYERLRASYAELGHELVEAPRTSVAERADFVLAQTALEGGAGGPA
jgi:predicted ATPase